MSAVLPYMDLVDMVLIMTVQPGFGGQSYIMDCVDKIKEMCGIINQHYPDVKLEIDGGVTLGNLKMNLDAGANVIVTGSAIFKGDIERNVKDFLRYMEAV